MVLSEVHFRYPGTPADALTGVNLTAGPVPLPADQQILLTSAALGPDGVLPPDTAVWLRAR